MLFRISVKEKTHLVILNGLICCLKENTKKKKYSIEWERRSHLKGKDGSSNGHKLQSVKATNYASWRQYRVEETWYQVAKHLIFGQLSQNSSFW